MENINNTILSNYIETRSWNEKQTVSVVLADLGGAVTGGKCGAVTGAKVGTCVGNPITGCVFGAFLGGVIMGSVASWAASPGYAAIGTPPNVEYTELADICRYTVTDDLKVNTNLIKPITPNLEEKIDVNKSLVKSVNLDENQLNVGKMHNVILSVLDGSASIDTTHAMNSTSINKTRATRTDKVLYDAILNSKEMKNSYNDFVSNNTLSTSVSNETLPDKVISLFGNVLEKYSSKCEDVVFLINKYTEVIANTEELTNEEKNIINNSLATALYSYNYWNKTISQK